MALPLSEIVALVSLAAALLLVAQALPWPRPGTAGGRGGGDALLLDLLHGAGLQDLATRANMILLCHAILIALLGNAGILTNRCNNNAAAAALKQDPWAGTSLATERPEVLVDVAAREIVLVEKQGTWRIHGQTVHGRNLDAAAAEEFHHQLAVAATADDGGKMVSPTDLDDQEEDGAEEVTADWQIVPEECPEEEEEDAEEEEEEEEDLDEMNRRFEAFIAATKEKMRMEALHPQPENRALIAW